MRTWGRVESPPGSGTLIWQEVTTDQYGNNDLVWVTTLCQCLLLNLGESPFYATFGIPAQQSVEQQIPPDYYMNLMQQAFAPYFASLIIARTSTDPPTYQVNVTTHAGVTITATIPD